MLQRSDIGYAVVEADGRLRDLSPELSRWLGFDHHEVPTLAAGMERLVEDPLERTQLLALLERDWQEPEPPDRLVRVAPPDGAPRWLRFRFATTLENARVYAVQDLTDRHRAEEALRTSEGNYRAIFEAANEGIFVHAVEDGAILDVNRSACRLWGYSRDEFRALGLTAVCSAPPYGPEDALRAVKQAAREAQLFEWRSRHRDGRELWIEVNLKQTVVGGVPRVLAVVRDITERRRAARELSRRHEDLERAHRELERLHHARDEFLAMVSHELRTPLVTGMGYIELLLEGALGKVPDTVTRRMSVAHQNLRRLASLIDDLLDYQTFSHWGAGRRPEPETVTLAPMIQESRADFLIRNDVAAERVELALVPDLPQAFADPDLVRMVLANLLENAARHAGPQAQITIGARRKDTDSLEVTVTDDGVGIDESLRKRIFDPFVRSQEVVDGSGLGLTIVRGLLEAQGSTVRLESAPDRGTAVSFTLPVATPWSVGPAPDSPKTAATGEAPQTADSPRAAEAATAAQAGKVVLVDDDQDTLDLLTLVLEDQGHEVTRCASAEHLLERLAEPVPAAERMDLFLIDIGLPRMSGAALCRVLKQRPDTGAVPVYMFTARVEEQARAEAFAAGADGYIVKPIVMAELMRKVNDAIASAAEGP